MKKKKDNRGKPSGKSVRKKRFMIGILVFAVLFGTAVILLDRYFVSIGIYPYTRRGSWGSTIVIALSAAGFCLWIYWKNRK